MAETQKKMGRPKLDHKKDKRVQVRFTDEEWTRLKKCADKQNLTITQFVRQGMRISGFTSKDGGRNQNHPDVVKS